MSTPSFSIPECTVGYRQLSLQYSGRWFFWRNFYEADLRIKNDGTGLAFSKPKYEGYFAKNQEGLQFYFDATLGEIRQVDKKGNETVILRKMHPKEFLKALKDAKKKVAYQVNRQKKSVPVDEAAEHGLQRAKNILVHAIEKIETDRSDYHKSLKALRREFDRVPPDTGRYAAGLGGWTSEGTRLLYNALLLERPHLRKKIEAKTGQYTQSGQPSIAKGTNDGNTLYTAIMARSEIYNGLNRRKVIDHFHKFAKWANNNRRKLVGRNENSTDVVPITYALLSDAALLSGLPYERVAEVYQLAVTQIKDGELSSLPRSTSDMISITAAMITRTSLGYDIPLKTIMEEINWTAFHLDAPKIQIGAEGSIEDGISYGYVSFAAANLARRKTSIQHER